jgi:hypothetical protein
MKIRAEKFHLGGENVDCKMVYNLSCIFQKLFKRVLKDSRISCESFFKSKICWIGLQKQCLMVHVIKCEDTETSQGG